MSNSNDDQKRKNEDESVKMLTKNSKRSPTKSQRSLEKQKEQKDEKSLDKTQEISGGTSSPEFKIDKEKRNESHRNAVILSGYSSRRVRYKKSEPDDGAVNIDADLIKNDKTLRDEDWFLEKIENCKTKKLHRTCVCPFPRCYRIIDAIDNFKGTWQRMKRVCFLACCPPCCCIIQRSAFWPPRREYYFFKPPPNDVSIEVYEESEAILMKARKKKLKKLKRAKKCVPGERYRFGLSHPCANDVKYVEGFAVKTANKNTIGCIHIACPDGYSPRFTLLYSHPNGSDLSDHLVGVPSLVDLARFYRCEVYSYDYSGYGISGGVASEKNLYADIRAVYEYITIEKHVDPKRIVLLGYSIGSAATVELLRQEQDRKPAGVILQAPPTSILRVIGNMVGRKKHLDKPTCCIDRFVTLDKIHEVQIPILIIHGKDDKTVPIEHGELLCQRAITKVVPEWVPEAAHDNIENCREVWRRIRRFVKVPTKSQRSLEKPKEQNDEKSLDKTQEISGGTSSPEFKIDTEKRNESHRNAYITIEKHVDPKRIVLLGYSIGSAATVELLRQEQDRKPAGVILQAPPTSILRVIGNMVGRKKHLDKPTCCIDRFVTLDKIHEIQIPILIIHGKDDKTVPIEHGELLCQRAITKVVPEWVPEAAHDNIENCREVWRRIRRFVKVELKLR